MLFVPDNYFEEQEGLIRYLVLGGAISGGMCVYRLAVTLWKWDEWYNYDIYNNAFAILALGAISLWCIRYTIYRLKDINHTKDYRIMKNISLFTAVCCFLRVVTAAVYFVYRWDGGNAITYIYVVADILLWIVLGLIFVEEWRDKCRKEKDRILLKTKEMAGEK